MKPIKIYNYSGDFAENKDIAKELRVVTIEPFLKENDSVVLDFKNVSSATQSFIHALISETIRQFGVEALDKIKFKNCSNQIKTIISIVVEYVQDGIFTDPDEKN